MAEEREPTDLETVTAMAERLKLKGKEKSQYIHDHMTGLGYRSEPHYVRDGEEGDGDSGSGRFGFKKNRKSDDGW